nr:immunoglobulin light chain junction region [Macaca mulatta]MOV98043.1 immunoglobulin light chain junction region [Macaca mulatta]MOW00125.1 immunoglobulin light chain junction region [Macaca mulatta]MOW01320.1 immunoglobulin light chain junction region [Macaca mulatta]MOW01418.1 immunoglobulin light chain junction region [Macaca mulatta]
DYYCQSYDNTLSALLF